MTRLDLHVHSRFSRDAEGTILQLAKAAKAAGLDGFALTDHNTIAGHKQIKAAAAKTGMLILPGVEVSTIEGHVLALGVTSDVESGQGIAETAQQIHDLGGAVVPSHPLKLFTGIGPSSLEAHAVSKAIDGAEARNARERTVVQGNTLALCKRLGLATTGGSDVHQVKEIGACHTVFHEPVTTTEEAVEALLAGRMEAAGAPLPRHRVWRHSVSVPYRVWKQR